MQMMNFLFGKLFVDNPIKIGSVKVLKLWCMSIGWKTIVFHQMQETWYDTEYLEISMKAIQNIYWIWLKYKFSIISKMNTVNWICQSIHLYNRIHDMLDLSLLVTHVAIAIMLSLNYIVTHSFGLLKHFGRIHLLPQFMLLYLKFYVKEIVTIFFTTKDVSVERNVIIVEI